MSCSRELAQNQPPMKPLPWIIFRYFNNYIKLSPRVLWHRLGYWHQRADNERHGNPPQCNQELLVFRDKVGRPPGELGVRNSMECDIFPFVLWHCWLGDRKGIWPVKKWVLVCWWWWFDWSFAWLIAPVVQLSPPPAIILSLNKHQLTQFHLENGR